MSSSQVKKPRTIKRACQYCKQKHIKCDGTLPCYQCERRDLKCVYNVVNEKQTSTPKDNEKVVQDQNVNSLVQEPTPKSKSRKLKESNNKKRKVKDLKFIPIKNDKIINNSVIIKNPPDDSWIKSYKLKVEPFISFESAKTIGVAQLDKIMSWDYQKIKSLSVENLIELLPHLTSIAHGSRYCDNLEVSVKNIHKSMDILEALYSNNAHTLPQYSQILAGGIESIIFYLTGHGEIYKTRELAAHAQHLLNTFSESLYASTKRTIYAFLIGKTLDYDEMELWINKARMLPFNYTKADVSSWIVLIMFLTTKPLANLDKFYFPNLDLSKDPLELKHYQLVLSIIEYVETLVWNYETLLTQKNISTEFQVTRIYKLVLYGHKALTLCKCGLHIEALSYANEVINSGLPDICRLPFILSLYYSCLIAMYMKKYSLYYQGIETLNKLKTQYPLWQMQIDQLSKEFANSLNVSEFKENNNYEFRDESDQSTNEYISPTSYHTSYNALIENREPFDQFCFSNESPYEIEPLDLGL